MRPNKEPSESFPVHRHLLPDHQTLPSPPKGKKKGPQNWGTASQPDLWGWAPMAETAVLPVWF